MLTENNYRTPETGSRQQATKKHFRFAGHAWLIFAALLAGCGGSNSDQGGSTPPPVAQADFSISAPASVTVTPNTTQSIAISVVPKNGFTSQVSVTLSGLPAGVTASPATFSLNPAVSGQHVSASLVTRDTAPGASQTVIIAANASAIAGPISLNISVTSGSITHVDSLATGEQDFALTTESSSVSLTAGSNADISVSADAFGGFSDSVAVTLAGLPAGVTATPSTLSLTPGTPQTVTLTAASTVAAGTAALTLQGTSGSLAHNLDLTLTLAAAPPPPPPADFSLSLTPGTLTLAAGGSAGEASLSATAINGFTGPIAVTMSGLPSGIVAMPSSFTLNPGTAQPISFTAASSNAASTTTITLNATASGLAHSASLSLTVTAPAPDFTLQATPATLTLNPGAAAQTVSVTASALNGFTGQVQVALSGLPANVTASPTSLTLTPGTAQTISVTPGANAAAGTGSLHLTATSGTITHTASVGLTITSATPDFVLSVNPATVDLTPVTPTDSIYQPVIVVAAPINGFNEPMHLTVSGLTSSIRTDSIGPLAPGIPQRIEFYSQPTSTAISQPVTVTVSSASVTHSAQLLINVSPDEAPDFTILAPTSLLLAPGVTAVSVSFAAHNALSGSVAMQLSGLPQGATADFTSGSVAVNAQLIVHITVPAGSPQSSGVIRLVGSAAGITHERDVPYTVVSAPGFNFFVGPSTLNLSQGATANLVVGGVSTTSDSWISFSSYSVLPVGVTSPAFGPNRGNFVVGGTTDVGSTYIPFTAAADAPLGQTDLTFTVGDSVSSQLADVILNIVADPAFTLSATPNPLTVTAGKTATFQLAANSVNGFTGNVTFNLAGSDGLTVSPSTLTVPANTVQPITVSASSTAYSGQITVQATSGNISQSTQLQVTVAGPPPDFTVSPLPSFSLGGLSALVPLQVTVTDPTSPSLSGYVNAVITGAPTGLYFYYAQSPFYAAAMGGGSAFGLSALCPGQDTIPATSCSPEYEFVVYAGAAAGSYPLNMTATLNGSDGSTITHTYSLGVMEVVPPDFTLSTAPASIVVAPGTSQTLTITATQTTPWPGSIVYSFDGAPSGVTVVGLGPNLGGQIDSDITPGGPITTAITLSAAADAVPGTTGTITIQGTNTIQVQGFVSPYSPFTHSIQIPVTIGTPP